MASPQNRAARGFVSASRAFAQDASGAALVEAAIVLPILIMALIIIAEFGIVFSNYVRLNEATGAGARQFSVERGLATPWTDTVTRIKQSAPTPSKNLSIVLSVNGAACASDADCATLLEDAQGQPIQVKTTYSCNLSFLASLPQLCPIAATMTGRAE